MLFHWVRIIETQNYEWDAEKPLSDWSSGETNEIEQSIFYYAIKREKDEDLRTGVTPGKQPAGD